MGEPDNPVAWLVTTARRRARDRLRREAKRAGKQEAAERRAATLAPPDPADAVEEIDMDTIADDQLAADLHLLPSRAGLRRRRWR